MKIIITEEQLVQIKNILEEGKRATIFHKSAPGTTNQEYLSDNTYDDNSKKISLKNYLRLPGNRLEAGKSNIYNINNEKFVYVGTNGRKVIYKGPDGNIQSSLIDNLFIIP